MLETILGLLVHLVITVLVVKLYTDIVTNKKKSPDEKMTWRDANTVIEKLESRISHLQERDAISQEKIWNLEDQNRVLKLHMLELRREISAKSIPSLPFSNDDD